MSNFNGNFSVLEGNAMKENFLSIAKAFKQWGNYSEIDFFY